MLIWSILLACELLLMYTAGRRLSSRLLTWTLQQEKMHRWGGWMLMMPGTALHELSHALVVLILGGKISAMSLFRPRQQEGGVVQLGYVEHSAVMGGPLGGALVGMAPLVGVPAAIWGAGLLILPEGGSPAEMITYSFHHPFSLGMVWLLVSAPVSLGALPSPSDHRDLIAGSILLAILLAALSLLGLKVGSSLLLDPLIGWAQLLIVPAAVSILGLIPANKLKAGPRRGGPANLT